MRISDWSSDVCSSDLNLLDPTVREHEAEGRQRASNPKPGDKAEIGGDARAVGEDPSPDHRARGETLRTDQAPPLGTEQGSRALRVTGRKLDQEERGRLRERCPPAWPDVSADPLTLLRSEERGEG